MSSRSARPWKAEAIMLRVALGVLFIVAGVLKVLSLNSPQLAATVLWDVLGRSVTGVVLVATMEVLLGLSLVVGLWSRYVVPVLTLMILGATAYILVSGLDDTPCGCFGALRYGWFDASIWLYVRNGIIVAALARLWWLLSVWPDPTACTSPTGS